MVFREMPRLSRISQDVKQRRDLNDDDWFASASILSRTLATTADTDDPGYDRGRVKNENTVILDRGRLSIITFAFHLYTFERKAMSSDFPAAGSEDLPNSSRLHLDYIAGVHFVNRLFLPPLAMLLVVGVFPKPQNPRRV